MILIQQLRKNNQDTVSWQANYLDTASCQTIIQIQYRGKQLSIYILAANNNQDTASLQTMIKIQHRGKQSSRYNIGANGNPDTVSWQTIIYIQHRGK